MLYDYEVEAPIYTEADVEQVQAGNVVEMEVTAEVTARVLATFSRGAMFVFSFFLRSRLRRSRCCSKWLTYSGVPRGCGPMTVQGFDQGKKVGRTGNGMQLKLYQVRLSKQIDKCLVANAL